MFLFVNYSGHGMSHDHMHVALFNPITEQGGILKDPKAAYFKIEYELRKMAREK